MVIMDYFIIFMDFLTKLKNMETFKIIILMVSWWSANDVYSREFTNIPVILQKKYNSTTKEINNSLSLADKKVLDHITKQVITNNKEFINRLFL